MTTPTTPTAPPATRVARPVDLLVLAERQPHLGHSGWHPVTQGQVDLFAEATGDRQWIRVDPERAANGPFGTTIAHGYLTLSLAPMLLAEVLQVDGVASALNYGLNKVRFPAPVPVGSRIQGELQLLSAQPRDNGVVEAVLRLVCRMEDSAKPACVAEMVVLYLPA